MKQRIQLSDHFTFSRLIRFVLPSIAMMLCTSLYSIVDGFFVSNYVGKTSFAAVNLMMPVLMAVAATGFMIGTGGTAIVARKLGEGEKENANRYFSMLVYVGILLSTIVSVVGFVFMPSIARLLKADGKLLRTAVLYGRILFAFLPASALQNIFQAFFVTAEKPHLSFRFSVGAGLANMLLDYLFVGVFEWGLAGAAVATGLGQIVGGILPLIYFALPNNSLLRLTKTGFESKVLLQAFGNGSSEMVSSISSSIVGIFYNYQLLRFAGEDGVAAYGVIMYVNFIFAAIFIGYAIGSAPLVSYHYGAENHAELTNLYRKSLSLIGIVSVVMFALSELLSSPLVSLYVGYDKRAFRHDGKRLSHLLDHVPHLGLQHLGFIVLHGTRKRRCFSVDFVFAHAGVPACVAHSSAGIMEDRRRLVVGRGCRGVGVGFDGILLGLQEKEIPLRLKSHRQKHGEQRVRRALLLTYVNV